MDIGDALKQFAATVWRTFVSFAEKFIGDLFTSSAKILIDSIGDLAPQAEEWARHAITAAEQSGAAGWEKMPVALKAFRDSAGDAAEQWSDTVVITLLQNMVNVGKSSAIQAVGQASATAPE